MKITELFNRYIIKKDDMADIMRYFKSDDSETRLIGVELFKQKFKLPNKFIKNRAEQMVKGDKFLLGGVSKVDGVEHHRLFKCSVITNDNNKVHFSYRGTINGIPKTKQVVWAIKDLNKDEEFVIL